LGADHVRSLCFPAGLLLILSICLHSHVQALAPGVKVVPLAGNDLRFSSVRKLLYVAVGARSDQRANTVTIVEPATGQMLGSVLLSGEPSVLALSSNEKYLYVGLAEGKISRIDLDQGQVDLTFASGGGWVVDIEVFPDLPESIVASAAQEWGPLIAVFDNGVRRPQFIPPGTGVMKFTFGSDSQTLWGYDSQSDAFTLYRLVVSPAGISAVKESNGSLFPAFGIDPLFRDGLVIANGFVFDPITKTRVGRYYSYETVWAESFAIDGQTSKIYYPARYGYIFAICEFDLDTYRLTGLFSSFYADVQVPYGPDRTVTCESAGIAMSSFMSQSITIFPHTLFRRPQNWQPPPPSPLTGELRRIPLQNNGIVADPSRGRLYASLPNWAYDCGNSVVAVDAVQGTVSHPVWVGADPWQMAVSAENKYLYTALYNGWAVQRLTLPELTPDLLIPIKSEEESYGMYSTRVNELLAVPNSPESFVVARAFHPLNPTDIEAAGVAAYDGDRKRPLATGDQGWLDQISSIQWSGTDSKLYGFPSFCELSVTSEGVVQTWATDGVTSRIAEQDLMACQYDICFTRWGHIIDAVSQERLGEFHFDMHSTDFGWPEYILPDLDRGLVYFLMVPEYAATRRLVIEAYDVRTRHPVSKLLIESDWAPTGFVKWRDDQLAASTSMEMLLLPLSLLHDRPRFSQPVTDLRPQFRLIFPFVEQIYGSLTGLAVSNLTSTSASLIWSAWDELGMARSFVNNSVGVDLEAGRQWARMGPEIFGGPMLRAFVEVSSDNPGVGGFFMYRKDGGLDGATAATHTSRVLYFPRVATGPETFRGKTPLTSLHLVNPNGYSVEIQLTVNAVERRQEYYPPQFRTGFKVPAKSVKIFEFYDSMSHWGITSGHVQVEVVSPRGGITGFQRIEFKDEYRLETMIALNAIELDDAKRYYSQFAVGSDIFTNLKLVNVSDVLRRVVLKAVDEHGSPVAASVELDLEPDGFLEKDVEDIFSFKRSYGNDLIVGSLLVEVDGSGVIGNVVFGDPTTLNYAVGIPLQSETVRNAVFNHVGNVDDFFTGLALFNPGSKVAEVRIAVLSADGEENGEATQCVGPGERIARLLTEWIPSTAGQGGGSVVVRSTVPIVAQQMFGDFGLKMFSAVPPSGSVGEQ
jgi:hypothetical protein